MQSALRHRGPDASHQVGWDSHLTPVSAGWQNALVHTRLSIIDPRPEADQPMANDTGDVWLVYNGEVYGWADQAEALRKQGVVFRTRSDTEFILRGYEAWGINKLLANLSGMFAFAILDRRKKKVYLARDRMGEKPLVYAHQGGELIFGSIVRAVLPALPVDKRGFSPDGIDAYLAHRYIPAPRTVFSHISRLENGHYLEFDLSTRNLAKHRYWESQPERGSWMEALDRSVRLRTVADRPLGVFLSGGIDSTVVASRLAQQRLSNFRTFTAAFPGSTMDESQIARRTADTLGLSNTKVIVPQSIATGFERIVADLDEPFADPSSFPTWYLARAVTEEVKVVLTGDGGDELFAGYKRFAKHLRTAWRRPFKLPWRIAPALEGKGAGKLVSELAMSWQDAYSLRFSGFTPAQRIFVHTNRKLSALSYWRSPDHVANNSLEHLLAIDFANYLPEYILRKSDLCTMAHGLEARAPLLDHQFVQRIQGIAPAQRFTRPSKILLEAALDPLLPRDFFQQKKRGFSPPLRDWLRVDLADRLIGVGERLQACTGNSLAGNSLDKLVHHYLGGAEHVAEQVLQILILDTSLAQLSELARGRS